MVIISPNYITSVESKQFIDFIDTNNQLLTHTEQKYWYRGIDIKDRYKEFSFLERIGIENYAPQLLRVHKIDSISNTPEVAHYDDTPFSFIIFLNDNFTGGLIKFKNITVTPAAHSITYFTKDAIHSITKVESGTRYTLVGFLDKPISFDRKISLL